MEMDTPALVADPHFSQALRRSLFHYPTHFILTSAAFSTSASINYPPSFLPRLTLSLPPPYVVAGAPSPSSHSHRPFFVFPLQPADASVQYV